MTKTNADAAEKASEELRAVRQLLTNGNGSEVRKNREGVLSRFAVAVGVGNGAGNDVAGDILIAVLREPRPLPPFFSLLNLGASMPDGADATQHWCHVFTLPCDVDAMPGPCLDKSTPSNIDAFKH